MMLKQGAKDADVIYTDVWVSMGEPDEVWESRLKLLLPYQVNKAVWIMLIKMQISCIVYQHYHDLKTKVGKDIGEKFGLTELEVTDEVFEGKAISSI